MVNTSERKELNQSPGTMCWGFAFKTGGLLDLIVVHRVFLIYRRKQLQVLISRQIF
jgi:hypothetical protein